MKKLALLLMVLMLTFGLVMFAVNCSGGGDDDDSDDDTNDDVDDDVADDDTTDDDTQECDVQDVCDYIFDNNCDNNWGWESREECYNLFMEGCKDEEAYYDCVCPCVYESEDCDEFKNCEFACWDENCE